jgi:hypothetical protein
MGQHASTESYNTTLHGQREAGSMTGTRSSTYSLQQHSSQHRRVVSEDETMVDVSPAPSMLSGRTRTDTSLPRGISRIIPHRTAQAPSAPVSSSVAAARHRGRSSLWCRVQSLRNRIYRTSRNGRVVEPLNIPEASQTPPSPRPSHTSIPLTRRHSLRNSLLGPSSAERASRRNTVLGTTISHGSTRPLSFHPLRPDPFVDNIDPQYEHINDPLDSHNFSRPSPSTLRRRSIWGHNPSPPTSPRPPPALSISPPVIDRSTQTTGVGTPHSIQPFNITRRPGEDQAEMLSRFLYVAGAALAASLVGSTESTTTQLQEFSADFIDASQDTREVPPEGSFEGFLRALRQGRAQFAHALRHDAGNDPSAATTDGEEVANGFTYLLMYRFNSRPFAPSTLTDPPSSTPETPMEVESPPPASYTPPSRPPPSSPDPRMVPFVIIGVQPVPSRDAGRPPVPSFSEGVATLIANARQTAEIVRPTSSSASPNPWRESRRRASIDGSFRRSPEHSQTRQEAGTTRAWQMYIYGGAYPENHLIFTAPTLFTDVLSSKGWADGSRRVMRICYFWRRYWGMLNPRLRHEKILLLRGGYSTSARQGARFPRRIGVWFVLRTMNAKRSVGSYLAADICSTGNVLIRYTYRE